MPNDILTEKLSRLESIPLALSGTVETLRADYIKLLAQFISTLETKGGELVLSGANLSRFNELVGLLDNFLFSEESKYLQAVTGFAKEIGAQASLSNQYYKGEFQNFAIKDVYAQVLRQHQLNTIELFSKTSVDAQLTNQIRRTLQVGIETNQSISQLIGILEGNYMDFSQYAKTWSITSFSVSDAQYQQVINKDLGVEFFEYVVPVDKATRDFCAARAGQVFTLEEVESWASLEWSGKIAGTDENSIFVYRGGWNCRHQLSARAEK